MAIYAIGDVQGCFAELQQLLSQISFDPKHDKLWFAGDLVNRGPQSLEVLRFVKNLGSCAKVVLGNHDLHLLALAHGLAPHKKNRDLLPILTAPDRVELLNWLASQPLLQHSKKLQVTMIHAGLPPQWDLPTAQACAKQVETILSSDQCYALLAEMYADKPRRWKPKRKGIPQWRYIINCFTRLRYCDTQGRLALDYKGHPDSCSEGFTPWFAAENRLTAQDRIVFGHWSTLGLLVNNQAWSIDTGCVWGGSLTALRLDTLPAPASEPATLADADIFSLNCSAKQIPGL